MNCEITEAERLNVLQGRIEAVDQRLQVMSDHMDALHDDVIAQAKIRHDHICKLFNLLFDAITNKD